MRHFHRTSVGPDAVMQTADAFFGALGLKATASAARTRGFAGELGTLQLSVRMEGGHYTFVEVHTDQIGESRLDKNVKKFFVALHKQVDRRHAMEAGY
ncbi:hypothetical protein [Roseisolibacter sp. H3M3-2]|uniref:hypothetical protein n=1 Tax=Roseisolibacter sp. H3M3-2 TaxID=3031323 RepID=UPI0023DB15C3|nr:hypothetical protein [Roseisolibacter sp. H3M3-2]MDF1502986.1 hypothetical protein [Roseisolibacter sp. H3M3-2]